jgi:hypothetical protein
VNCINIADGRTAPRSMPWIHMKLTTQPFREDRWIIVQIGDPGQMKSNFGVSGCARDGRVRTAVRT